MAHVADRKDARHTGFEQAGGAFERPTSGRLAVAHQGRAGQDEAAFVARHHAIQPIGAGLRADEYKQSTGVHAFVRVGPAAFDGDGLQMVFAVNLYDVRLIFDLYVRGTADLVDQVLRHGRSQRLAAHQHHYPPRKAREVEGGLSRGIGAAHDIDIVIAARHGFGRPGSVIDTGAGQAIHAGHVQLAPLDAGGDQQRLGGNLAAVGQAHDAVWVLNA